MRSAPRRYRSVALLGVAALAACGTAAPTIGPTVSTLATLFGAHRSISATIRLDFSAGTYSGVMDGKPVSGKWGPGAAATAARLCPGSVEIPAGGFAWSGTFEGKSYTIDGCQSAGTAAGAIANLVVSGNIGGERISAHAAYHVSGAASLLISVPISGSVGAESLTGTATARMVPGQPEPEITARFTVG